MNMNAGWQPGTLREVLADVFRQRITASVMRRALDLEVRDRTYQNWLALSTESGETTKRLPRRVQLALVAILRALDKGSLVERVLPNLELDQDEEERITRVSQMIRRARFRGTQRVRTLYEEDLHYLETGKVLGPDLIPLCARTGPPYVSEDDIKALGLFVLSDAKGRRIAFSYMSPVEKGLPGVAFKPNDIDATVYDFYQLPDKPTEFATQRWNLLLKRWPAKFKPEMFFERAGPGLRNIRYHEGPEERGDAVEWIELAMHHAHYFEGRVTNHSLDETVVGRASPFRAGSNTRMTYRDEWADHMSRFDDTLPNLMQTNGLIITNGDSNEPRVHLAWRGVGTATNPGKAGEISWAPSVSGAASVSDCEVREGKLVYRPERTLLREGGEEVWGRGLAPPGDEHKVRFLGLSRVLGFYEPFLFGHIELNCKESELRHAFDSNPRDRYDVSDIQARRLDPETLLGFVEKVSPLRHKKVGVTVSVVIFMLYHELRYRFPNQIREITDKLVSSLIG